MLLLRKLGQIFGRDVVSGKAVTRDDQGRVIPLSERFNPQSDDIRYAKSDRDPDADRLATRALSAVRSSPGEYKNLLSWTRANYGDSYDPALSDHENAARALAGIENRPDNLRGVAGVAFQRFRTAMGKGSATEPAGEPVQAARDTADTPRQREMDKAIAEVRTPAETTTAPAIPEHAPELSGTTWRDVRRDPGKDFSIKEEPAYKSEQEFLDDYKENGEHDARETPEEFLKRRFCGGRS